MCTPVSIVVCKGFGASDWLRNGLSCESCRNINTTRSAIMVHIKFVIQLGIELMHDNSSEFIDIYSQMPCKLLGKLVHSSALGRVWSMYVLQELLP